MQPADDTLARESEDFVARWQQLGRGTERSNFQRYFLELTAALGLDARQGASNFLFEHKVTFRGPDGSESQGYIDCYKPGCFVLEAKQSRQGHGRKVVRGQLDLLVAEPEPAMLGRRSADRSWDVLMMNARRQAEDYAKALPTSEGWPPFLLVCDVAHCIEVYADFSGQGKNYSQFPDRQNYRIYLEDIVRPDIRERLRLIWTNPRQLDPTSHSIAVTREVTGDLAELSKKLEARGFEAETVALFLMRCIFTMFAEDVGLLPEDGFKTLLRDAAREPRQFVPMVEQLWKAMDKGEFAYGLRKQVKRFNGYLFKEARALDLRAGEIAELAKAAAFDWKQVEPSIFGSLLEDALDPAQRSKLGAHYTPRAYVERLVIVTVMEPLRQEWSRVQATAERLHLEARDADEEADRLYADATATKNREAGEKGTERRGHAKSLRRRAVQTIVDFHARLCETRVLDPACGTGNFLYVTMQLMKELESEILESLVSIGGKEALAFDNHNVGPEQFLGMEINTRAKAIAELVLWIGWLRLHMRARGGAPSEPIIREYKGIRHMDAVLTWDGWPVPKISHVNDTAMESYPNARKPKWDEADFIVGNPPFIGGKDIRERLGSGYAETLWNVYKDVNDSADYVMYWWDRAAEIIAKGSHTKRFGLVTTNSITGIFSRRVIGKHLDAKKPISLLFAIPDHPWTRVTADAAAVRIAMTVGIAGSSEGVLRTVLREDRLDTDDPNIELSTAFGRINADLSIGADTSSLVALRGNEGLASRGMALHGAGFIVTPAEAEALGLGKRPGLERHIRPYRNGKDLTGIPRGVWVIDLHGLQADDVRKKYPEVYEHLLDKVKPERDRNNEDYRRVNWWLFGRKNTELRGFLAGLDRYIATVETSKHRFFQFLDASIIPDNKLVCLGSDDAHMLGVLSSQLHVAWALRTGALLEDRPVYVKSRCVDPFPFPECSDALKDRIRAVAEELDAFRKARQAEHPRLTMTQMYNVLEKLRAGEPLAEDDQRIKAEGLVGTLRELHDTLDALVFEAYGWTDRPSDDEIIARLVDLNRRRALEETAGNVRWLRPDYQIPRFGTDTEKARIADEQRKKEAEALARARQGSLALDDDLQEMKPTFPTDEPLAETAAVVRVLTNSPSPLTVKDVARHFRQGRKIERRVDVTMRALVRLGQVYQAGDLCSTRPMLVDAP